MTYALLKAGHLVSLFVWIGGMTAVALALRHSDRSRLDELKTYDRAITSPAMVAAWVFGLSLAVMGDWFSQSWLVLKIPVVLALSGLHGVLVGNLRRRTAEPDIRETSGRSFLPIGLVLVAMIVLLVTLKI